MIQVRHLEIFPTSLFRWESVLDMQEFDYISKLEFEDKEYVSYEPLEEKIHECVRDAMGIHRIHADEYEIEITEMWGNVSPKGKDHHPHSHPNNYYSGIFYLTTGEPTVFLDPRPANTTLVPKHTPSHFVDTICTCDAIPNSIVLFNSWLHHYVPVNKSDQTRKTLSFNVILRGDYGPDNSLARVKI